MFCENSIYKEFSEDGIPHCAACGMGLDREWRFYVRDGIPYCRECLLTFSAGQFLRICETSETKWLLDQGFEAWGRLPDGEF